MTRIERSVLLPYAVADVYALINDVAAYPEYMEGCVAATVHFATEEEMEATLTLARHGFRYAFTTRNALTPCSKIRMTLVDGPFSEFAGEWTLQALGSDGCKVTLSLAFTLQGSPLLTTALKPLMNSMADRLVDTVVKRASRLSMPNSPR